MLIQVKFDSSVNVSFHFGNTVQTFTGFYSPMLKIFFDIP